MATQAHSKEQLLTENNRLRDRLAELEAQADQQQRTESALTKRVRELTSLYGLAELITRSDLGVDDVLQAAVALIPPAWKYSEQSCVRLQFEGKTFTTPNFTPTEWRQAADLLLDGQPGGSIEVFYRQEMPPRDEGPFLQGERHLLEAFASSLGNYLERQRAHQELRQTEWMLAGKAPAGSEYTPEYGDLSLLNENGLILSSVGKEMLCDIASEYLDLLETSAAIYERNGDYALGLFSSGWCQLMDAASRRLCGTSDNREALQSGKWLCHESCWQDASLQAIETGEAVDIECSGGIRMYALPVKAGGEIVGSVNFGYGNPPTDEEKLRQLSRQYRLPVEELREQAEAYPSRPQFILDYAKTRLEKAAAYLGAIIEREQATQALRASEEHLRITLDSIGDAVVATDLAGRVTGMNPVAEALTGWEEAQARGKPLGEVFRIVNVQSGEPVPNPVQRVLETGKIVGLANHTKLIAQDGTEYQIADSASPIQGDDGETHGVVLVFRDVTEEYQMRESLRESELRFRRIYENMSVGVAQVSLDFTIVHANKAYCRMLGYSLDELCGKNLKDITEPEILEENLRQQRRLANGELAHFRMEKTFLHKDGHTVFGILDANLISDLEGNPLYFLGSVLDITDRVQAEEKLKSNYALLRIAGETAKFGGWSVDLEKNICTWSDTVADIHEVPHGYAPPLQEGINFYAPEWREKIKELFSACAEKGIPYDEEMEIITSKGKRVWVRTNGRAVKDENGKISKVQGSFQDITERKQAEESLRESEEKMCSIYRVAPTGIGVVVNRILNDVNPRICEMAGYTRVELIGKNARILYPSQEDYEFVGKKKYDQIREKGTGKVETRWKRKDGTIIDILLASTPIDIDDHSKGVTFTALDITKRKRAEEALKHSHSLMKYIIEHTRSAIAVHDRDLKYIYVSQRYLDDFKVKDQDIIGKHHYDVFPDLPQKWRDVHQKVLAGEIVSAEEDLYEREDGSVEWTRWECRPWYKKNGSVGGIIVYTEVITERKRAEDELRRLKDDLQAEVAQKTRELQERVELLERFHDATIERELRMKKLRDEIARLKGEAE